jgi:DNA-binding NarL/FixJ family response regulator
MIEMLSIVQVCSEYQPSHHLVEVSNGNADIEYVDNIVNVFPLVSDQTKLPHFVCIEAAQTLDPKTKTVAFDMINALMSLIKYVNQQNTGRESDTKIAILANDSTDAGVVKQLKSTPNLTLITVPSGIFDPNTVVHACKHLLHHNRIRFMTTQDLGHSKPEPINSTIKLTPREQQILTLIRDRGASNKVIAKMLNLSESTVKLHVGKALKKYGCNNRTQLALFSKKPNTEV